MHLIKATLTCLALGALLLVSATATASPQILQWQTGNGARVYFVSVPELPMVDLRIVFDAGAARDGNLPGLAALTNGMLEEGADGLNADAIAEAFARLGASFSASSHRDMATVSLRSLSRHELLEPALETFIRVLTRPDFPAQALERVRKQMLTGLQYQEQQPGEIAGKAFYRALYGNHPYATPPNGTPQTVATISREEVQHFYHRHYVANNAVVAIVGDLDRSEAELLAEATAGALPAGEPAPALPAVTTLQQPTRRHISHPSSQTHILMGQPGVKRGDPDYFPLYVGNHILGGSGLVSRISDEVREKRGLAYSAYSYFSPMRAAGPFVLGSQTRNESADEALQVLRETLERFRADGPTGEELQAAKRNITGGFPLKIDANRDILGYIAMIGFYGLPLDYLETFNQQVEAVSAEQIRNAFQRRIDPERLVTITVGTAQ